jgi:hypothetical protein
VQNAAIEHHVGSGQARSICQYVGNDKVNADIREPRTLGGKTHSLRRDVAGADIVSVLCQPDAIGSQSAPDLQHRSANWHVLAGQAGHHRRDRVVLPGRVAATVSTQLISFRTPHAGTDWLETNSETNWVRSHAIAGEQTCGF